MKKRKWIKGILLLLTGLCTGAAHGQDLLQKIRAANSKPDMEYGYKIVLHDMQAKKRVDSTQGRLSVKAGQYRDSNTYAFTARVGDTFCKLDHLRRTATVCNMKELARRMGVRIENNENKTAFDITESLLHSKGSRLFIDAAHPGYYRLSARLRDEQLSYVQVDFSKADYKMVGAYFEQDISDPADPGSHRLSAITIRDVRHIVPDAAFDLGHIYTLVGGKAVLAKKYANYHLVLLEK